MKRYHNMEFRNILLEFARLFEPNTYVEVGVRKGFTFKEMCKFVKRAIAIDIVEPPIPEIPNAEVFVMDSNEFVKHWSDPIDFLFIDADHRFNSVMQDFNNLIDFVPAHTGLVFLHDTFPVEESLLTDTYCSDAWRAARLIHRNNKYNRRFEIVTLPGPWAGLSIIRKVYDANRISHGWMDNG